VAPAAPKLPPGVRYADEGPAADTRALPQAPEIRNLLPGVRYAEGMDELAAPEPTFTPPPAAPPPVTEDEPPQVSPETLAALKRRLKEEPDPPPARPPAPAEEPGEEAYRTKLAATGLFAAGSEPRERNGKPKGKSRPKTKPPPPAPEPAPTVPEPAPAEASEESPPEPTGSLFDRAVAVAMERGSASPVLLTRRLGIGYARARALMDSLVEAGILGEMNASGSRPVKSPRK
jgi:DNA segregation ATPase FtsK/SpoIIIE-like protein